MNIWLDIITHYGNYIIASLFLISLCSGIAILFLKNRKEHQIILDKNNYEERRKTTILPTNKNDHKTKDGYTNKTYRGTDIETAAWEDKAFENKTGRTGNASAYQQKEGAIEDVKDFPDFETTFEKKSQFKNEINGIKQSLMNSIAVEIKDNYREHGIVSSLKTTGFEENLVKEKIANSKGSGMGF